MLTPATILAALAIVCFALAAFGKDDGRGIAIGLVFLTLAMIFAG